MSVLDNACSRCASDDRTKRGRATRARDCSARRVDGLLDRRPSQLSGGQTTRGARPGTTSGRTCCSMSRCQTSTRDCGSPCAPRFAASSANGRDHDPRHPRSDRSHDHGRQGSGREWRSSRAEGAADDLSTSVRPPCCELHRFTTDKLVRGRSRRHRDCCARQVLLADYARRGCAGDPPESLQVTERGTPARITAAEAMGL